ncbi:AAA family ATPase [Pectobacterium brasiliense]|uniref:ATP-binding protein n=1 Tax=Pectobacterium brasiliense TaxID=180957 RepID=UPI00069A0575|nr:ATP-binding protein [Pectobacterium brasiliense]MCG5050445.1 AAA family ATPase [Pectobacterium brasiliense]
MTFLKPTLIVKKLTVFQHGHLAFNCDFHKGVNIIRGRNSSGKTTIMDMLAFSLGAENIRWKPQALKCTMTMVEVSLNNNLVCLKRDIAVEPMRPMYIFWGGMDDALAAGSHEWEQYPFKRSENKISFTQAIFNALDLPLAQGAGSSNLTLHQVLRVLYADQPSVHSPIFRFDKFDNSLTRETVGGYICGIYNDELYNAQLNLREVDTELSKKVSELKSIFNILGRSGHAPDMQGIDDRILELSKMREIESNKITNVSIIDAKEDDNSLAELRTQLNDAKSNYSKVKSKIQSLEFEISDSELFIQELDERLRNLEQSGETRGIFDSMSFEFCPSCLTKVDSSENKHSCHLCKSEELDDKAANQLLRMKNELALQVRESNQLMVRRRDELVKLKREVPLLESALKKLEQDFFQKSNHWSSPIEAATGEIYRRIGGLDEEIKTAYENKKLIVVINELQEQRDKLQLEKNRLDDLIKLYEKKEEKLKEEIYLSICTITKELLQEDLPLQKEFIEPENVEFSFTDNSVYVNGSKNFSESSAVVLRHVFHLALLSASIEHASMRLPRFLMLDGIDDGGMEKDRSHNLQSIIIRECSNYEHDYQLIFATSEINPEYQDSEYVVGEYYSPNNYSLNIID